MELGRMKVKDFCCFKKFDIPLSNQGLVWISGKNFDSEAAKNNGSGKSTIFKALTWGLYGKTIDGEAGDKIIRQGQKKAVVEIDIEVDDVVWTIRRERTKGSPELSLLINGEDFSAPKDELQKTIIDLVGLDFSSFRNTILYGQNDSARFANPRTKDVQRKNMLHKILKTGIFEDCHKLVMEDRLLLKKEVKKVEREIGEIDARLGEYDLDDLTKKMKKFEFSIGLEISVIEDEIADKKTEASVTLDSIKDLKVENVESDIKAIKKKIKKFEKIEKAGAKAYIKAREMENEKSKKKTKLGSLDTELAVVYASIRELNAKLEVFESEICPTCNTQLDSDVPSDFKSSIEFLKKEHIVTYNGILGKRDKLEEEIEEVEQEIKNKMEVFEDGNVANERISELDSDIFKLKNKEAKVEAEIEKMKFGIRVLIESIRELKHRINMVEERENPYDSQLFEAKKKIKKFKKELKKKNDKATKARKKLAHLEFWAHGFSGKGLPSFILDSVMPFITNRSNYYLRVLADGDITMNFSTQRELKSAKGELRDVIDITWEIEGNEGYPPSGGQLKKMEIATDLALMDLVATKESGHIDMLALDEVLDGLDSEGRQRVLVLLQKLRGRRGSVFVISHETDMAEIFEKAIYAVKKDGVSALEQVA